MIYAKPDKNLSLSWRELSNEGLLDGINNPAAGDGILVSPDGTILGGHHRKDELLARIRDGRINPDTPIRIGVYDGEWCLMSLIHSTDPDFRVCQSAS